MATFIWSIAITVDARAYVFSMTLTLFYMGNKVLGYSGRFCKLLKVLLIATWSVMLLFIVYFTAAMWRPYDLHCMPKLNKSDLLATWCTDAWPDVYKSVFFRFVWKTGGAGGNGFE